MYVAAWPRAAAELVEVAAVEGVVEELVGFEDWAVAEEPSLLPTSLEDEEADDKAIPSLLTKGLIKVGRKMFSSHVCIRSLTSFSEIRFSSSPLPLSTSVSTCRHLRDDINTKAMETRNSTRKEISSPFAHVAGDVQEVLAVDNIDASKLSLPRAKPTKLR